MLPEKVTKLIGQAGDVTIMEVEKGAIRRYAHAIDDLNPLYLDDEYAKNSKYGAIIAPPGFFGWPAKWTGNTPTTTEPVQTLVSALSEAGYSRRLDGGVEFDFFIPVRAGDILAALTRIIRISERETKSGKLIFSVAERTYTNQNGALVASARQTFITR